MNEDKVRAAAKVAVELARDVPEHTYREVWQSVFHAVLWGLNSQNTATEDVLVVMEQDVAKFIDDYSDHLPPDAVSKLREIIGLEP